MTRTTVGVTAGTAGIAGSLGQDGAVSISLVCAQSKPYKHLIATSVNNKQSDVTKVWQKRGEFTC